MPGLFDSLYLGRQSLQVQQQAMEVAGHNLANVNNPAYARQRVQIQTLPAIPTLNGMVGTGAEITAIEQLRSVLLDAQLQGEFNVRGSLEAQQSALQLAEAVLGQQIDRTSTGSGARSFSEALGELFTAFHSLSTNPASMSERQVVLMKAQDLASRLNQFSARMTELNAALNSSVQADAAKANELLTQIAGLNAEIFNIEASVPGSANDLRDLRQQKIEELSRLVNVQTTQQPNGLVDISISGVTMIAGVQLLETITPYDPGTGQLLIRATVASTPLALTGGSIQGTIEARDGAMQTLRDKLNTLAATLITEVNALHVSGFSLNGSSGAAFFTGTDASDIAVNSVLLSDPALLQAAGVPGAAGDNQVALALGQLANQTFAALGNQTFSEHYGQTVVALGQSLSSINGALEEQDVLERMLLQRRDSVSGVSLDEEMTDLVKFQKAFEASARLITTVDEMLETVINM